MKPKALVDPHPRTLDLLFNPNDLKRLKSLVGLTVWETGRMPAEMVDKHLPKLGGDRPDGSPARAVGAREEAEGDHQRRGELQPNIDYEYCFQRGIHVLGVGVAFGQAVAEMSLGMALNLARGIPAADRLFRHGKEVYGRVSNREAFLMRVQRWG